MKTKLYAIYDANDDIAFAGDSKEAADFLGMSIGTLYSTITRQKQIANRKTESGYRIYCYKMNESMRCN